MSRVRAIVHLGNGNVEEIEPARIDEHLSNPKCLLWLDIEDPTDEDAALLREEFGFHELALEDAMRGLQRPKLDEYEDYYFMVLYSAECTQLAIRTHEIHAFWGKSYFVTLHDDPVPEIDQAIKRWESGKENKEYGVAFETYALLDAVIDGYFPVVDAIADRIEDLEDRIFDGNETLVREIFTLRKQLFDTRKVLAPSRDVLNELARRDIPIFPEALVPYLADVYDHAIRVIETLDLHHDLLSSAVETHLSVTSNRLNQTMRTMTALTIGLMVPTLIAGIYGMNYQLSPPNDAQWGFWFAMALMGISATALFAVFKRIGWI